MICVQSEQLHQPSILRAVSFLLCSSKMHMYRYSNRCFHLHKAPWLSIAHRSQIEFYLQSRACYNLSTRAVTSNAVGARVNVLRLNLTGAKSDIPITVFVLPVPGGPHICFMVLRRLHLLKLIHFETAASWESFRSEHIAGNVPDR